MIEINCLYSGCEGIARLRVEDLELVEDSICPVCGRGLNLSSKAIADLKMFARLVREIRRAEPILGQSGVAVQTESGEVIIPYRLLVSRMTTQLALDIPEGGVRIRILPGTIAELGAEPSARSVD